MKQYQLSLTASSSPDLTLNLQIPETEDEYVERAQNGRLRPNSLLEDATTLTLEKTRHKARERVKEALRALLPPDLGSKPREVETLLSYFEDVNRLDEATTAALAAVADIQFDPSIPREPFMTTAVTRPEHLDLAATLIAEGNVPGLIERASKSLGRDILPADPADRDEIAAIVAACLQAETDSFFKSIR